MNDTPALTDRTNKLLVDAVAYKKYPNSYLSLSISILKIFFFPRTLGTLLYTPLKLQFDHFSPGIIFIIVITFLVIVTNQSTPKSAQIKKVL